VGWSITNILLDLTGGIANFSQMLTQSIDQSMFPSTTFLAFCFRVFLARPVTCYTRQIVSDTRQIVRSTAH
jgi:hypothetical protein